MNDITTRFIGLYQLLLEQKKVSNASDFASKIGIKPQLLTEYFKGRTNIGVPVIQNTVISFQINSDYLLLGNGPIFKGDFIKRGTNDDGNLIGNLYGNLSDTNALLKGKKKIDVIHDEKIVINKSHGIPYYELLPASAGNYSDILNDENPNGYINLPQLEGCIAVFPVFGSSMKGLIEPGDLIAIKELAGRTEFDPSVPYLIITRDHRMIKYLRADDTDTAIVWAESTNHKPIKIEVVNILFIYAIKCVIRFF